MKLSVVKCIDSFWENLYDRFLFSVGVGVFFVRDLMLGVFLFILWINIILGFVIFLIIKLCVFFYKFKVLNDELLVF